MDNKALFKLGTFVKNTIFGKPKYLHLASELGVDRRTDPVFILEELEKNKPDMFYEIMDLGEKTNSVKELVNLYLK